MLKYVFVNISSDGMQSVEHASQLGLLNATIFRDTATGGWPEGEVIGGAERLTGDDFGKALRGA